MSEFYLVYTTIDTKEAARELAEPLVRERLAACANLFSPGQSCFRWEGEVKWEEELFLFLKTRDERLEALKARLVELHPYEVPAIEVIALEPGHKPFEDWVTAETTA